MNDCIGIGKILGHKFEARVDRNISRFGSEDSTLEIAGVVELLKLKPAALAKLDEFIAAKQGWMDQSQYLVDVCARCGKVVKAVDRPPPLAKSTIPVAPHLHAVVKVGPIHR